MNKPLILFIDLFCGAGGVTTGAVRARMGKYQPVKTIACVNHDPLAIESHEYNHKNTLHFSEDVRNLNVVNDISRLVELYRAKYPDAIVLLWASMECTNYSKAKGGMPRDPDSRSLPEAMYSYIEDISPDYFYYENVAEFMAWGPLDKNGRPISMKKGQDYLAWIKKINNMGYRHDKTMLNAADFGAHTKRNRLFGIFAKDGLPIRWPEPTHTEKPQENGLFQSLKPWRPVRECLEFEDEGKSIFTRKKPLVENTLKRIFAGLKKYVANGDGVFISKYYGNGNNVDSVRTPAGTLRTKDCLTLVTSAFLDKGYSGVHNHQSIETPAGSIPTKDHYSVVKSVFLDKQYKGDKNHQSINAPAGSVLSNPKHCMVQAFLDRQFSQGTRHQSIEDPAGSILTVPKMNLVEARFPWIMDYSFENEGHSVHDPAPTLLASRRHFYVAEAKSTFLMNPQWNSKGGSVNEPSFTLIARMDKAPPYLIQSLHGVQTPKIKDGDCWTMRQIKGFCFKMGITDITTRMLNVSELKRIQGFGDDYYLAGTQTDQKKFIGNAVVPVIVKRMMEALSYELKDPEEAAA